MTDINKTLSLLPEGRFKLNLPEIVAVRGDEKITGSGCISQLADGKLAIAIVHDHPPLKSEAELLSLFFLDRSVNYGQSSILTGKDYYACTATDEFGNQIECKYIHLEPDMLRRKYTGTFKSNIWLTSPNSKVHTIYNRASLLLRDKYSFATNTFNSWQFDLSDMTITYEENEEAQKFNVVSTQTALTDPLLVKLIQSLDFVMGLEHQEYYTLYQNDTADFNVEINVRYFSAMRTSYFTPPYRKNGSQGDEAEVNKNLFSCYFNYLIPQEKNILTKWHKRVVDSGTGYYYKHGLIAIAIEKILGEFYKITPPQPDPELLAQLHDLKTSFSRYSHPTLLKNLQNLTKKLSGQGNFIAAKRLAQLEKEKVVSPDSTESWQKLRNAYAHGEDYTDDLKDAIDLVQRCTTIYYELVFNLIGYQGRYTNYFIQQGSRLADYAPKNL